MATMRVGRKVHRVNWHVEVDDGRQVRHYPLLEDSRGFHITRNGRRYGLHTLGSGRIIVSWQGTSYPARVLDPSGRARTRRQLRNELRPGEDEDTIALRGFYGSGIRDRTTARHDVRRRFGNYPPATPTARPGARFYVTARQGSKVAWLLGPYASHMTALANLPRARALLRERYPNEAFYSVGTASRPDTIPTVFGRARTRSGGRARVRSGIRVLPIHERPGLSIDNAERDRSYAIQRVAKDAKATFLVARRDIRDSTGVVVRRGTLVPIQYMTFTNAGFRGIEVYVPGQMGMFTAGAFDVVDPRVAVGRRTCDHAG